MWRDLQQLYCFKYMWSVIPVVQTCLIPVKHIISDRKNTTHLHFFQRFSRGVVDKDGFSFHTCLAFILNAVLRFTQLSYIPEQSGPCS